MLTKLPALKRDGGRFAIRDRAARVEAWAFAHPDRSTAPAPAAEPAGFASPSPGEASPVAISRKAPPASETPGVVAPRILASAVYVTGSSALEAGRRYVIAVHGSRLRFMGPIDVDPSVVSVDRPIAGANATALEGRLVISAPEGRSDMVVAFMSVAGTTPDALARAIVDAARASGGL